MAGLGENRVHRLGPLYIMTWAGGWWFRFFGKGIAWQDENVNSWRRFSVRHGHTFALFVETNRGLKWRFEVLS